MYIVYKPPSVSCGEIIEQERARLQLDPSDKSYPAAFSGRLDPMAHGDLIIVPNSELNRIEEFNKMDKTYKFKFVIGVSTDTTDVLGIFNNLDWASSMDLSVLKAKIESYANTTFDQKYHRFSSFVPKIRDEKKNRKPLWSWSITHPDFPIDIPSKSVSVRNLVINSIGESRVFVQEAISSIGKLNPESKFRQGPILTQWADYSGPSVLPEITCTIEVSSGFYIRQFVQDLSDYFKVRMMVTEIYRTKVADQVNKN